MATVLSNLRPRLIAEWRAVLQHAWSVRFSLAALAAAALTGIEAAWPFLETVIPVSPAVFAALSGLFSAAALLARVIYQESVHDDA